MKVALLHFTFADYTISLANALAEVIDVTLFHPESMEKDCVGVLHPRIQTRSFLKPRLRSVRNLSVMRSLLNNIRAENADVLHLQANGEPWFELNLLWDTPRPFVTTSHDVNPHPGDRMSFRLPFSRQMARIPYFRSDQLIVHTYVQKRVLTEWLGIKPEKINVIQLGNYGDVYRRWAGVGAVIPEREPNTILFFGRIWPYKGLGHLIDAMPLIAEQVPQVKLLIAGRGEDLNRYFPNGVDPKRFEIVDQYIPNAAAASYFQRSSVVCLPYIEASQSGVAAVAYGLGTPVVASRVGGLGEMIRDGEDGLLVEPGNSRALAAAIIRLFGDTDLQSRMRAAAALRCQDDLNWSNTALKTIEVYQRAMQTARRRP